MDGHTSRTLVAILIAISLALGPMALAAAESDGSLARSMLDDAELSAVTFVDTLHGWAVGDRGVIWRTDDGGESWQLSASGVSGTLRTVFFADSENGCAAGGEYRSYLRSTKGILLRTSDGGRTWETDKGLLLSTIHKIKFFGGPKGWALSEPSAIFPSGVFCTDTGGRSWTQMADQQVSEWTVGDFADPFSAVLAGGRGARGTIRERNLAVWQQSEYGVREPRAIHLTSPQDGWLVGDGGLLLATQDGGRSWQPPLQQPRNTEPFDWRAVTAHGSYLWIAGSPGTLVLHSADSGATWETLPTGQCLPINSLTFVDADHGWAVGALGTILVTSDGGNSWQKQRGARQRAALLAVYSDADRTPLEALARLAGNEGYVTAVELIARRDAEPDTPSSATSGNRERAALVALGCSAAEQAWGFPLRQKGVQSTAEQIVDGWNRMYSGHGVERLEEHLVRRIRMWKPEVIITSAASPAGDDPLGHLVNQVVLRAVTDAADPQKFPEQIRAAGLSAWAAKKVAGSLPPGKLGTINVNTSQLAPRLAHSLADYSSVARGLIDDDYHAPPNTWGFRLHLDSIPQGQGQQDFFSGISLQAGGDARREMPGAGRAGLDAMRQIAEKHRNLQAILAHAERTGRGGTLLGQVEDLTRGLDASTAGQALFELAQSYYVEGQWEFAAPVFQLLSEKYPTHPLTTPALEWLVQYWSSGEAACRAQIRTGTLARKNSNVRSEHAEVAIPGSIPPASPPGPSFVAMASGRRDLTPDLNHRAARHAHALEAGQALERIDAQAWSDMHVQFPLAQARAATNSRDVDRLFHTLTVSRPHDAWWACAKGEQWLSAQAGKTSPKTTAFVRRGDAKPRLDGQFDDELWKTADRLELTSPLADDSAWPATAMLAYDDEFLYIAISCRQAPQCRYATDDRTRERDADLSAHDRVELLIDVDRDWTTFYRLSVDHRGWTAEACWHDATWNPRWFVAASTSEENWTVEMAIPLASLSTEAVVPKTAWVLGLQRISPGAGFQSWTRPATVSLKPEGCGYLIFD
ncbi:MAG TPA: YCF48-related protein [Pirellulales bacterium]|jgi:photosystem II stability/assembly factor-like uncharacterized protein